MAEPQLHLVTKAELRGGGPRRWEDPSGLLRPSPRIERMLLGNPLSAHDDDPVQVVATIEGRVASRVYVMPGELRYRGAAIPALWGFDLEVGRDFRGKGLAKHVVRGWRDARPTAIGNWVNRISAGIYPKLGWTTFETPVYQRITRSRRFLDGFLRFAPATAPAALVVDAALGLRHRAGGFARTGRRAALRLEPVTRMSDEVDALLARDEAVVTAHRSARWMNWMLECGDPADRENQRLCYVRDGRDALVGYVLLVRNRPALLGGRFHGVVLGIVKDWMVFDADAASDLAVVLLGLDELSRWGADALLTASPGFDAEATRMLERQGYRRRDDLRWVCHAGAGSPLAGEEFRRPERWRNHWVNSDGLFL